MTAKRVLEGLLRPAAPVFVSHNYVDPSDFADAPPLLPPLAPAVIGCVGEFRRGGDPDAQHLRYIKQINAALAAIGQAFFSLSLGMGAMITSMMTTSR